jgi:hypothetical protein
VLPHFRSPLATQQLSPHSLREDGSGISDLPTISTFQHRTQLDCFLLDVFEHPCLIAVP